MKLIFVPQLPPDATGAYCHGRDRRLDAPGWTFVDLKPYFRSRQEAWFDDLGLWHGRACETLSARSRDWWLHPLSRIITFQPAMFAQALYARSIADACRSQNFGELYLVDFDPGMAPYVRDFLPEAQVVVAPSPRSARQEGSGTSGKALKLLKTIGSLALAVVKNPFRAIGFEGSGGILVFSQCYGLPSLEKTGDHFFHSVLDDLPGLDRGRFFWLYWHEKLDVRENERLARLLKSQGRSGTTVLNLLRLTDLARVAFRCLRSLLSIRRAKRSLPPLTLGGVESRSFPEAFCQEALRNPPAREWMVYYAVRRLLKGKTFDRALYPFESKGMERAFLRAVREKSPEARVMAYAHAVYNPGLLYVRHRHEALAPELQPDVIGCTGPALRSWLERWGGLAPSRLEVVGSSRHRAVLPAARNGGARRGRLSVLVLLGLGHEMDRLAEIVAEDPNLFDDCRLVIRKYPYSWHQEQSAAMDRIRALVPHAVAEDGSLADQLKACDAAIVSSSSAGLEAILSGRPTVYMDLHGLLDLDPFAGKDDNASLIRCDRSEVLKKALENLRASSDEEYEAIVGRQRRWAERVFASPDIARWTALLSR